jgi:hypothetical protein
MELEKKTPITHPRTHGTVGFYAKIMVVREASTLKITPLCWDLRRQDYGFRNSEKNFSDWCSERRDLFKVERKSNHQ